MCIRDRYVGVRHDAKGPSLLVPEGLQKKPPRVPEVSSVATKPAPVAAVAVAEGPASGPSAEVSKEASLHPATRRRFEMQEGDTRYFWEIEQDGEKHRVRFGTFQAKVKKFDSESEAETALAERIQEKLENGFVEVDGE